MDTEEIPKSPTINENSKPDDLKSDDQQSILYYQNAVLNMNENSLPTGVTQKDEAINLSTLSTKELLDNKSPTHKITGYQKLTKSLPQMQKEELADYIPHIKGICKITNPRVLKEASLTLDAFCKHAPCDLKQPSEESLISTLIKNQFSSPRLSKLGLEMALKITKMSEQKPALFDLVLREFSNKKPVVVSSCTKFLFMWLNECGPEPIPPAVFQGKLASAFQSTSLPVRKNALELACEMYRWGGEDFLDFNQLEQLKKSQIATIRKEIAKIEPNSADPPQKLDQLKNSKEFGENLPELKTVNTESLSEQKPVKIIIEEKPELKVKLKKPQKLKKSTETRRKVVFKAKPVDVFEQLKIDENWIEKLLAGKWQIKKQMLEEVIKKVDSAKAVVPNPKANPFFEAVGKLLTDPNINTTVFALKVFRPFAKKLEKHFQPVAKRLCYQILAKFKEKKQTVENSCFEALCAFTEFSASLDSLADPISKALRHNSPKVRGCTMEWMSRSIERDKKMETLDKTEFFAKSAANLFDDGTASVRTSSYKLFASLLCHNKSKISKFYSQLKMKNKRAFQNITKLTNSRLKSDSSESCDSSEPMKSEPSEEKIASRQTPKKELRKIANPPKKAASRKFKFLQQKPDVKTLKFPSKITNKFLTMKRGIKNVLKQSKNEDYKKLVKLIPTSVLENIKADQSPDEHIEGLKKINLLVCALERIDEYSPVLVAFLTDHIGWDSESLPLNKELYKLLYEVLSRSQEAFGESVLQLFLEGLLSKLVDAKLNIACSSCLNIASEVIGPELVVNNTLNLLESTDLSKHPKTVCSALKWVQSVFDNFDIRYIANLGPIVHSLQRMYRKHREIKAVSEFCHKTIGAILSKIEDAEILAELMEELSGTLKVEYSKKCSKKQISGGFIDCESLKQLETNKNWQKRHSALKSILTSLAAAIDSGEVPGEKDLILFEKLFKALSRRLKDKVVLLVRQSLQVLRKAPLLLMGETSFLEKCVPLFSDSLIDCICSSNRQVYTGANQTLDVWIEATRITPFINKMNDSLCKGAVSSVECKKLFLNLFDIYVFEWKTDDQKKSVKDISKSIVKCASENSSEAQKLASAILVKSINLVGKEFFVSKYPLETSIRNLIDKQTKSTMPRRVSLLPSSSATLRSPLSNKRLSLRASKYSTIKRKTDAVNPTPLVKCRKTRKQRSYNGHFRELSKDDMDSLKSDLNNSFPKNYIDFLFSSDEKKPLKAIKYFSNSLEQVKEIVSKGDLDLVFMAVSFVISTNFDCNTIIDAALDLIEKMLDLIEGVNTKCLETWQLDRIVPFLIQKLEYSPQIEYIFVKISAFCDNFEDFCQYFVDGLAGNNKQNAVFSLEAIKTLLKNEKDAFDLFKSKIHLFLNFIVSSSDRVVSNALETITLLKEKMPKNEFESLLEKQVLSVSQKSIIIENFGEMTSKTMGGLFEIGKGSEQNSDDEFVLPEVFKLDLQKLKANFKIEKTGEEWVGNCIKDEKRALNGVRSYKPNKRSYVRENSFGINHLPISAKKKETEEDSFLSKWFENNKEIDSADVGETVLGKRPQSLFDAGDVGLEKEESINNRRSSLESDPQEVCDELSGIRNRMKNLRLNK